MESECKIELNAAEAVKLTPTISRASHGSKLTVVLIAVCLAAAAAFLILNTHTKSPVPDEDQNALHHKLREISNVRAAIHLEGEYNPNMKAIEWTTEVDQSHAQGGLQLINNEIVIPQTGLYFVYSQASFRVSCSTRSAEDVTSKSMVHLSHAVKRWSSSFGSDDEKSYQTILHSVRTACQKSVDENSDSDESWFSAIYMGAVFSLRRGDRLKTVMEERMMEKLEDEPGKTFFGVFAL
ncbi:tumor necrosis factor a (TNF superfamily, member 2) [Nothobranchius furzeri]|uniref:Tumor necrosis factor n=1 Tax=Nothobranchius furzeri TaxID=105023 RepID=A0A1A7ZH76_NOTFU|nr:tumor necrosis factor a (TNF superfamily, member 2) isoform X2 [Nothobranchius furzeri]KAF7221629.1 tumor necrosis factor-like [Nothobranchius furzeri]